MSQVIEAPYDKMMKRTQNRPIPSGRLTKLQGSAISAVLGTASLGMFSSFGLSTCLTATGIWAGYICLYIPLKRITRFNTHLGAVVGAAPAYLGWVAATGSFAGYEPLFMALYMFSWQFPHFYGILWTYKQDFARAGYKMITNIDENGRLSHRSAMIGCIGELVAAVGMAATGLVHPGILPFGIAATFVPTYRRLIEFKHVKIIQYPNSHTGSKLMVNSYKNISALFIVMVTSWVYEFLRDKFVAQVEKSAKEVRKYEHLV